MSVPLTNISGICYLLDQLQKGADKVNIRTKEKCPKCGSQFSHVNRLGFICIEHQTVPRKYYLDFFWLGRRHRLFCDQYGKALDSYNRASALKSKIETEIENHQFDPTRYSPADVKDYLFEHRIEKWLKSKLADVEDGKLAESYTSRLRIYIDRYYMPFFKGKDIRDVRTIDITEFKDKLSTYIVTKGKHKDRTHDTIIKGECVSNGVPNDKNDLGDKEDKPKKLSLKYKKNILDALENFFNVLVENQLIAQKPIFPKETVPPPKTRWCRRDTQDLILSAIPEIHRPIFFLLTRQGIRPGEAVALRWDDINWDESAVLICRTESLRKIKDQTKGKTDSYRLLHPEVLNMLKSLPLHTKKDFVFRNRNTGRPYRVHNLECIWNTACESVGIQITLYEGTRHSVASQAASRGVTDLKIGKALGHADIRTTRRYAKIDVRDQIDVFVPATNVTKLSPREAEQ